MRAGPVVVGILLAAGWSAFFAVMRYYCYHGDLVINGVR
jgi:hypothetical protein